MTKESLGKSDDLIRVKINIDLISKFCKQEVELPTYEVCIYIYINNVYYNSLTANTLNNVMIISYFNLIHQPTEYIYLYAYNCYCQFQFTQSLYYYL